MDFFVFWERLHTAVILLVFVCLACASVRIKQDKFAFIFFLVSLIGLVLQNTLSKTQDIAALWWSIWMGVWLIIFISVFALTKSNIFKKAPKPAT